MERRDYLERLVMGLEMQIQEFRYRLPAYGPEDIEGKYAVKFLASMEANLEKARRELEELDRKAAGQSGP